MRKKVTVPDHWKAYYDEVAAEAVEIHTAAGIMGTLAAILREDPEGFTKDEMLAHARYLVNAYHTALQRSWMASA